MNFPAICQTLFHCHYKVAIMINWQTINRPIPTSEYAIHITHPPTHNLPHTSTQQTETSHGLGSRRIEKATSWGEK